MNTLKTLRSLLIIILAAVPLVLAAAPADSLVVQFGNRTRMVIYSDNKAGIQSITAYDLNKIVREMGMKLDSVPNGQTYVINERNSQRYLTDTTLVITRNGGNVTVRVNTNRSDTTDTQTRTYSTERKRRSKNNRSINIDFHLGLNTLTPQPAYAGGNYGLHPLGSRYFAFSVGQNPVLVRGNSARLSVHYALQIAWNNFMFEEDVRAERAPNGAVVFAPFPESLRKSKLVQTSLELPVVPQVTFYNSDNRRVFSVGVGGFVGYRIDSYTKIKRQNGDKDHDRGSFGLENFQYGVMAHLGILRTKLFVKYNLNNTFRPGLGPDVRALSFGLSF